MSAVLELAEVLEEVSGHGFDGLEFDRLTRVVEERARACGSLDVTDYVRRLCRNRDDPEWQRLVSGITISESYLFRAPQQLRAIADIVIPELLATRRPTDGLRVWSAGCARGEEAVSLAAVMTDCAALTGWSWSVVGTDVDEAALEEARAGEYGERAMSRVPSEVVNRHFDRRGDRYRARPHLLERVSFRYLNLMGRPLGLAAHSFEIVLLRNVLIYFSRDTQRRVVDSVARTLTVDGYLFLGPSESLRTLRTPLVARHFSDCYCYGWPPEEAAPVDRGPTQATAAVDPPPSIARMGEDLLDRIEDLLQGAQLSAARELMAAAIERSPEDPDLRGIQGWICERLSDPSAAVGSYRAALYLEPSLVQVRFLIAGCLWRLGRRDRARHEFRTVLRSLSSGRTIAVEGFERLGAPAVGDLVERCRWALEHEPDD